MNSDIKFWLYKKRTIGVVIILIALSLGFGYALHILAYKKKVRQWQLLQVRLPKTELPISQTISLGELLKHIEDAYDCEIVYDSPSPSLDVRMPVPSVWRSSHLHVVLEDLCSIFGKFEVMPDLHSDKVRFVFVKSEHPSDLGIKGVENKKLVAGSESILERQRNSHIDFNENEFKWKAAANHFETPVLYIDQGEQFPRIKVKSTLGSSLKQFDSIVSQVGYEIIENVLILRGQDKEGNWVPYNNPILTRRVSLKLDDATTWEGLVALNNAIAATKPEFSVIWNVSHSTSPMQPPWGVWQIPGTNLDLEDVPFVEAITKVMAESPMVLSCRIYESNNGETVWLDVGYASQLGTSPSNFSLNFHLHYWAPD